MGLRERSQNRPPGIDFYCTQAISPDLPHPRTTLRLPLGPFPAKLRLGRERRVSPPGSRAPRPLLPLPSRTRFCLALPGTLTQLLTELECDRGRSPLPCREGGQKIPVDRATLDSLKVSRFRRLVRPTGPVCASLCHSGPGQNTSPPKSCPGPAPGRIPSKTPERHTGTLRLALGEGPGAEPSVPATGDSVEKLQNRPPGIEFYPVQAISPDLPHPRTTLRLPLGPFPAKLRLGRERRVSPPGSRAPRPLLPLPSRTRFCLALPGTLTQLLTELECDRGRSPLPCREGGQKIPVDRATLDSFKVSRFRRLVRPTGPAATSRTRARDPLQAPLSKFQHLGTLKLNTYYFGQIGGVSIHIP